MIWQVLMKFAACSFVHGKDITMGTDTIAAIATAMTSSGIGIVRISGEEAVSITDRIFEMKNQKKLEDMPTHTIH